MPCPVGLRTLPLIDPARRNWAGDGPRPMLTHVWYPAAEGVAETDIEIGPPGDPFFIAGRAAPDAALAQAPKKFPLVLLSHGTGGAALQHAWLAARLAARGYVVAGINHHGNTALEPYLADGFARVWERAADQSVMLTQLLANPAFGPRIDRGHIGAAGFSLGGYTAIALAGGRLDLRQLEPVYRDPARDPVAEMPPEFPDAPALVSLFWQLISSDTAHRASFRDERVRAAFAIAPALGEAFSPAGLAEIGIPVKIVVGTADNQAPPGPNAEYFAAHIPQAELALLDGVGHYTFLATPTDRGRAVLPQLCLDPPGVDRDAVHARVASWAYDFFEANLT